MLNINVNLHLAVDNLGDLAKAIKVLTAEECLVGVPDVNAERRQLQLEAGNKVPINNASLAYIHDQGSPAANIPARPFMGPGITAASDAIEKRLMAAGEAALDGKPSTVHNNLEAAGLTAVSSIRRRIQSNIPPALKPGTIAGRNRRHKGRTSSSVTALIDTGAMLKSIAYVVRKVTRST